MKKILRPKLPEMRHVIATWRGRCWLTLSKSERRMAKRKGKERSEKGSGERVPVSTCVGSRGGGGCFVERGGGERSKGKVELEQVSADAPMAVRACLVCRYEALMLVLF
jgi:hypothetical protein